MELEPETSLYAALRNERKRNEQLQRDLDATRARLYRVEQLLTDAINALQTEDGE